MNKMIFQKLSERGNSLYCIDHLLEKTVNSDEILLESIHIANFLYKRGIKKGDAVALMLKQKHGSHVLSIYFANIWLASISTPINSNFSEQQKIYAIQKCNAKILITDKENKKDWGTDTIYLEDILFSDEEDEFVFSMPELEGKDILAILFTAGTTGKSKGVCMTANTLISNQLVYGTRYQYDKNTRMMLMSPLVHASTITHAIILPILFEFTIVLNNIFDIQICSKFWDIVEKDKVTVALTVPSMLGSILLFKSKFKHNIQHFKFFLCGSAVLLPSLKKEFEETFQVKVNEFYASTETAIIATTLMDGNRDDWKPIDGTEVKLAEDGEILVHSNYLFKGYINDPDETDHALFYDDGKLWYRTGDIGIMDNQGFFKLTDRKKDIIIKGGYNISPSQIDLAFMKHPYVSEVATIGIPDALYGEEILTFITIGHGCQDKNLIDELTAFSQKELEKSAWPKEIRIIDEMPKSNMGKIDKIALKKMA